MAINRRLFLAAVAAAAAGCDRNAKTAGPGTSFPDFRLPDIEGQIRERSQYAGQPFVANFWASWCPPCRIEMPDLDTAAQKFAAHGVKFIGFSVDDDVYPVREFQLKAKVGFPLVVDSERQLSKLLGVSSYPMTFLVSRNGLITETISGPKAWPDYPGLRALG